MRKRKGMGEKKNDKSKRSHLGCLKDGWRQGVGGGRANFLVLSHGLEKPLVLGRSEREGLGWESGSFVLGERGWKSRRARRARWADTRVGTREGRVGGTAVSRSWGWGFFV